MTGLGRSKHALKIPMVTPETPADHRLNNTVIENWARNLPIPFVKTYDVTGFLTDGSVFVFTSYDVTPGVLYRATMFNYLTGFSGGTGGGIDITPFPSELYGGPGAQSFINLDGVFRWNVEGTVTFGAHVTEVSPQFYSGKGFLQIQELEELA